ncbi:MAG: ribosome-associated translation inhibitor RaiA [Acidaminococcus sp.]|nr:ribosome-associated translation inhibitor RaiA [Acidaminococcus sp.]MDD7398464.1 ribosome-associated translation inhibitor RaiA [Bacillota bacterium]MDY4559456.1 ribosome-associated translation inhibitor RaiA [Eubacteriales bacterium]MDY5345050.1 ribosome-associated translation inhibitor RaiA [Eubacteriales bacterium]
MKIEYVGKGYNVSDSLKSVTEKKSKKFKKYLGDDAVLKYTITLTGDTYTTELIAEYNGRLIKAEAQSDTPFKNLDEVNSRFEGQARKFKTADGKSKRGWKRTYPEVPSKIETEPTEEDK